MQRPMHWRYGFLWVGWGVCREYGRKCACMGGCVHVWEGVCMHGRECACMGEGVYVPRVCVCSKGVCMFQGCVCVYHHVYIWYLVMHQNTHTHTTHTNPPTHQVTPILFGVSTFIVTSFIIKQTGSGYGWNDTSWGQAYYIAGAIAGGAILVSIFIINPLVVRGVRRAMAAKEERMKAQASYHGQWVPPYGDDEEPETATSVEGPHASAASFQQLREYMDGYAPRSSMHGGGLGGSGGSAGGGGGPAIGGDGNDVSSHGRPRRDTAFEHSGGESGESGGSGEGPHIPAVHTHVPPPPTGPALDQEGTPFQEQHALPQGTVFQHPPSPSPHWRADSAPFGSTPGVGSDDGGGTVRGQRSAQFKRVDSGWLPYPGPMDEEEGGDPGVVVVTGHGDNEVLGCSCCVCC